MCFYLLLGAADLLPPEGALEGEADGLELWEGAGGRLYW